MGGESEDVKPKLNITVQYEAQRKVPISVVCYAHPLIGCSTLVPLQNVP